jgi:UDP-4-amino-4,6-dideoxy-N-acetyl-beta-L-altrosamine transaminase
MTRIPYARQDISEEDIQAVVRVLRSDWLTQGPAVETFEHALAAYCGATHAVAVCNATAGLHLACRALGLGPGDELWTSPNTFVASANCALYCGASVDFVDIDPRTYNLSVAALEDKLQRAQRDGRLPKILVAVHFAGQPCDMAGIAALAKRYGFMVVEDASHALGALYRGARVGAGEYSDAAVFSFHPVKIITTGEGGMVTTSRPELANRLRLLRSHGTTTAPELMESPSEGPWYYQQVDLGYNYRMTDLQAALGESQLQRVTDFVERRRALAKRYHQLLADLPLTLPWEVPDVQSSFHLFVVRMDLSRPGLSRRRLVEAMRTEGVFAHVHYIPVHLQPYYRRMGFAPGDFPQAEAYYREALTLPLYPGLGEVAQEQVVAQLRKHLA